MWCDWLVRILVNHIWVICASYFTIICTDVFTNCAYPYTLIITSIHSFHITVILHRWPQLCILAVLSNDTISQTNSNDHHNPFWRTDHIQIIKQKLRQNNHRLLHWNACCGKTILSFRDWYSSGRSCHLSNERNGMYINSSWKKLATKVQWDCMRIDSCLWGRGIVG